MAFVIYYQACGYYESPKVAGVFTTLEEAQAGLFSIGRDHEIDESCVTFFIKFQPEKFFSWISFYEIGKILPIDVEKYIAPTEAERVYPPQT